MAMFLVSTRNHGLREDQRRLSLQPTMRCLEICMIATDEAAKRLEILKILTSLPNSKVSTAEHGQNLSPDELYVDLSRLDKGVQQGTSAGAIGHVVPKKAISPEAWSKIVALLAPD
jgi:hypothetical protein